MLAESVILTTNNASTDQKALLSNSSAKYYITLFAFDLNIPFEWLQVIAFTADSIGIKRTPYSEAYFTMLASENVLSRDWDQPQEDDAWVNL